MGLECDLGGKLRLPAAQKSIFFHCETYFDRVISKKPIKINFLLNFLPISSFFFFCSKNIDVYINPTAVLISGAQHWFIVLSMGSRPWWAALWYCLQWDGMRWPTWPTVGGGFWSMATPYNCIAIAIFRRSPDKVGRPRIIRFECGTRLRLRR